MTSHPYMDRAGMYRIKKYILDLGWTSSPGLGIPPERWSPGIGASLLRGGQHRESGIIASITNPKKAPASVAAQTCALNSTSGRHSLQPASTCVFLRTAFWGWAGRAPPSHWPEGALWMAAATVQNLYYIANAPHQATDMAMTLSRRGSARDRCHAPEQGLV